MIKEAIKPIPTINAKIEFAQNQGEEMAIRGIDDMFEAALAQKSKTTVDVAEVRKSKGWSDKVGELYNTCIYECAKSVGGDFLLEPHVHSELSKKEIFIVEHF